MGRFPWTTRLTVEECPIQLCARLFHRNGIINSLPNTIWTMTFRDGDRLFASLDFVLIWGGLNNWSIYLRCPAEPGDFRDLDHAQRIRISVERLHLGGQRYWFVCECKRASGKLYLPPGQTIFRCRKCYNLAYRSSQTHDKKMDGMRPKRAIRRQRLPPGDSSTPPPVSGYGKGAVRVNWASPARQRVECPDFLK